MAKTWGKYSRTIVEVALMSGVLTATSLDIAVAAASAAPSAMLYVTPTGIGTVCSQSDPCGVIQNAINTAVANDVGDDVTIDVAAGSYSENDSISASSLHSLTIAGAGAQASAVNGGGLNSVFVVSSGDVTISGLIIQNGEAGTNGGGGIDNDAGLTVVDSLLTGDGSSSSGGAIDNHAGATLQLSDSTVSGNTASVGGGGIENAGYLTLTGSDLMNNTTSQNTDAAGYGGAGIQNSGTTTVDDSTFSGNTSAVVGGAIANAGRLQVGDSSLTDNSAPLAGGGIWNVGSVLLYDSTVDQDRTSGSGGGLDNTGSVAVTASTFSENMARQDGGGIVNNDGNVSLKNSTAYGNTAANGGAIDNVGNTAVVLLAQSTVWSNAGPSIANVEGAINTVGSIIASSRSGPDCAGSASLGDLGYNLTDDTSCGLIASTDVHANPDLQGLVVSGGTTATAVPNLGSPAIGAIPAGTNTDQVQLCPRVDQRGISTVSGSCTIGAAEGGFLITTTSLPDATSGSPYGPFHFMVQSLGVSSPTYQTTLTWGAIDLPRWLTLTPQGVLTGRPHQKTARYPVTVTATETVSTLVGKRVVRKTSTVVADLSLKVQGQSSFELIPEVSQFPTVTVGAIINPPYPPACTGFVSVPDFARVVGGVAPYTFTWSESPQIDLTSNQYGIGVFMFGSPDQLNFSNVIGLDFAIAGTPGDEPVENSVITFTAMDATGAQTSVSFPWTIDNPTGITSCYVG